VVLSLLHTLILEYGDCLSVQHSKQLAYFLKSPVYWAFFMPIMSQ